MEDSHTTVLDLLAGTKAAKDHSSKLSFFGVFDGHGGDKVALFAGDNIHNIIAKQDTFKAGNYEQALKDGFLATDRAILNGMMPVWSSYSHKTGGSGRSRFARGGRLCDSTSPNHSENGALSGTSSLTCCCLLNRSQIRGGSVRLHCLRGPDYGRQDLCCMFDPVLLRRIPLIVHPHFGPLMLTLPLRGRRTLVTREASWA